MITDALNKVQNKRSLTIYCFIFLSPLPKAARSLRLLKEFRFILIIMRTKSGHILLPSPCFTKQQPTLHQPHLAFIEYICESDHWYEGRCCFLTGLICKVLSFAIKRAINGYWETVTPSSCEEGNKLKPTFNPALGEVGLQKIKIEIC